MQRLKCNYCGSPIHISEVWAFLHYITKHKYYVQCPKCQHISNYHIRLWLVHDTTDKLEKETNKQLKRWWKHDRNKNSTPKRPSRTSPQRVRVAKPTKQPKQRHNTENTTLLVERATRSRQKTKRSSCGIKCKPRLPEPMPNQKRHILETVMMNGRYTYDIQNRLIKKDDNYLARLTDKEAHRIVDELNRQDRKLNEYERTLSKIRKILRTW